MIESFVEIALIINVIEGCNSYLINKWLVTQKYLIILMESNNYNRFSNKMQW